VAILPEKTMERRIAGGVGNTDNLADIVKASGVNSAKMSIAAEVAEINGLAVLPKHRM
jgi:hypothetical protein